LGTSQNQKMTPLPLADFEHPSGMPHLQSYAMAKKPLPSGGRRLLLVWGTFLFLLGMAAGFLICTKITTVEDHNYANDTKQNAVRVSRTSSRQTNVCECEPSTGDEDPVATTPPSPSPTKPPTPSPTTPPTPSPSTSLTEIDPKQEKWAFLETFDGDPSSPSQSLLPNEMDYVVTHRTHPQEHFTKDFPLFPADHDSSCAGPDPNIDPLPQHMVKTSQNSANGQADESFYICKNHLMTAMGDVIPYSVSAFWPRQEFAVKGNTLEFDVNLNDGHTVRSWWEILITPRDQLKVGAGPIDSPISEKYPKDRIVLDFRRNVRSIRVGRDALPPAGWLVDETQYGQWDFAWWKDLHPQDPANIDHRIRRKMKIQFLEDRISWGIETEDGSMDEWSVDLPSSSIPFDQGLVVFKTHAYTPNKAGNMDTFTFHWDNIGFTGPNNLGKYKSYHANDVVYLQRNGDRPIGDSQEVRITLPGSFSPESQNSPLVLFGQVHHPMKGQVLLSINGGQNISIEPYEYDEGTNGCFSSDWKSFRLELDPTQLVPGANTFEWTVGPRPSCATDPLEWDGFSVKFLHVQVVEE